MSPDFLSSAFSAGEGVSVARLRERRGVEAIHDRFAVDAERVHARSIDIVCKWRFGGDTERRRTAVPERYLHLFHSSGDGFPARKHIVECYSRSTFGIYLSSGRLDSHILSSFFSVPSAAFRLPPHPAVNISK